MNKVTKDIVASPIDVGDSVLCPSGAEFTVKYISKITRMQVTLEWWSQSGNRYSKKVHRNPKTGFVSNVMRISPAKRDFIISNR